VVGDDCEDWANAGLLSITAVNAVALAKPVKSHNVRRAAFTDSLQGLTDQCERKLPAQTSGTTLVSGRNAAPA
jgi:hypothetical protein